MINRWLLGAIAALGLLGVLLYPDPEWRFAPPAKAKIGLGKSFETVFEYRSEAGTAHAPAIAKTPRGYEVIWFDGTRESARDVRILSADLPGGEAQELFTTQSLSSDFKTPQSVLILGNAIGDTEPGHYFATVVTLGGWAAASIAHVSENGARKLNLSPVLARSHLVKSPVVPMAGGGVLVPTYFEMSDGYGVAAFLNQDRKVIGQSTMPGTFAGIQPLILPQSATSAIALLRRFDNQNDRLLQSQTNDGGKTWTPPAPTELPNPNAPVAAVTLENGAILMLYNDQNDRADSLRFALSTDGGTSWSPRRYLETPGKGDVRYPMMEVTPDGRIIATYSTHGKKAIVAHIFTADWAMAK